jgi:hypothetical protein
MITPSIKALRTIAPDLATARRAKEAFSMSRAQLAETPAGAARITECYHPPTTTDLRLHVLNAILGTGGVEEFETGNGMIARYLNAGDTYAPTIVRFRGHYRVACWGDIAERHGAR